VNFPKDPINGTIFELKPGLVYQYDSKFNSWIRIASGDVLLKEVTPIKAGAMSAVDLQKLNRLVLPPPESTIIGTDCVVPFKGGSIQLNTTDNYINIAGNVDIKNIDQFGSSLSQAFPFHIHQHTFGFDFTLDLQNLIDELSFRGQLNLVGKKGIKGEQGDKGPRGIDSIFSGPPGNQGQQGTAPQCALAIEPEPVTSQAKEGLEKALVNVRVVPDSNDDTKFFLEFDRQSVGNENAVASKVNVQQADSFWVLAIETIAGNEVPSSDPCGIPIGAQSVYYLDIEPIVSAIQQKFLDEVVLLKQGYEDIVAFWIQTMSDLFDEQKDALCCALEYCLSKTKSTSVREHIESVQASAIGASGAKIRLHEKNDPEALTISSTNLYPTIGQDDICEDGQPPVPPPPPPVPPPPPPPVPPPVPPPPPPPPPSGDCTLIQEEVIVIPSVSCLYYAWADPNLAGAGKNGFGDPCETPLGPFKPVEVSVPSGAKFLQVVGNDNDLWGDGIKVFTANGSPFKGVLENLDYISTRYGSGAIVGINTNYGRLVGMFQKSPFNPPPLNSVREIPLGTGAEVELGRSYEGIVWWPADSHTLYLGMHDGGLGSPRWCDNFGGNNQVTVILKWYDKPCLFPPSRASLPNVQDVQDVQDVQEDPSFVIDTSINLGSPAKGVNVSLPEGKYVAIIEETDSNINGYYYPPIRIQHVLNGKKKLSQFLLKGKFKSAGQSQNAYVGLTLPFHHEGGDISIFYGVLSGSVDHGITKIKIQKQASPLQTININNDLDSRTCRITKSKLQWYEQKWLKKECCGAVVEIAGQDYIIIKCSIGDEDQCGGGEDSNNQCVSKFIDKIGHPAIAWPSLDGINFAPFVEVNNVLQYNEKLSEEILNKIRQKEYKNSTVGHRKLEYVIPSVLIPMS
jgi:hypothetical protein